MPTSRRDPESGLTLVEMLLVLAILALASGLVLGRGLPGSGILDRAQLRGFLVDARAQAMLSGDIVEIHAKPAGLVAEQHGTAFAVYDSDAPPTLSGPIWFLPDGTSNGGRIGLPRPGGSEYGADIALPTGRVSVWP